VTGHTSGTGSGGTPSTIFGSARSAYLGSGLNKLRTSSATSHQSSTQNAYDKEKPHNAAAIGAMCGIGNDNRMSWLVACYA
jgi:hypothetical protein